MCMCVYLFVFVCVFLSFFVCEGFYVLAFYVLVWLVNNYTCLTIKKRKEREKKTRKLNEGENDPHSRPSDTPPYPQVPQGQAMTTSQVSVMDSSENIMQQILDQISACKPDQQQRWDVWFFFLSLKFRSLIPSLPFSSLSPLSACSFFSFSSPSLLPNSPLPPFCLLYSFSFPVSPSFSLLPPSSPLPSLYFLLLLLFTASLPPLPPFLPAPFTALYVGLMWHSLEQILSCWSPQSLLWFTSMGMWVCGVCCVSIVLDVVCWWLMLRF